MLSLEILTIVSSFCDYKNAKKLSIACNITDFFLVKYCGLNIDFKNKIYEKLESFNIDANKFFDLLESFEAIISGSFILQILLDADWDSGDIDIYTTCTDYEIFISKMHEFFGTRRTDESPEMQQKNYYNSMNEFKFDNVSSRIGDVYTFPMNKNGLNVQLISIDVGTRKTVIQDIHDYIDRTFDFDFCKNTFNGYNLTISNRQSIIDKRHDLSLNLLPKLKFDRIIKYLNRGFIIDNLDQYYINNLSNDAIKKYKNRCNTVLQEMGVMMQFILYYIGQHISITDDIYINVSGYMDKDIHADGLNKLLTIKNIIDQDIKSDIIMDQIMGSTKDIYKYVIIRMILFEKMFIDEFDEKFIEFQQKLILYSKEKNEMKTIIYNWMVNMCKSIDYQKSFDRIEDIYK
jgi:hypothetical protein